MKIQWLIILLVIVFVTTVRLYRVLFVSIPTFSHVNWLVSISQALIEHHPDVAVSFALFDENINRIQNKLPEINIIRLGPLSPIIGHFSHHVNDGEDNLQFMTRVSFPKFLALYEQMHMYLLTADIVVNFDLLVIDMFAFAAQDLAHNLGVPFVIHSCTWCI
jgi:hypothetical protein